MEHRYKHLLEPLNVGNCVFKNRICYTNANPHFTQGPEDYPAEGFMTYYTNIAKSCAYVNVGDWCNPKQRVQGPPDSRRMQMFDISNPAVTNYISQLADDVHFNSSKMCVCSKISIPDGYSFSGGQSRVFTYDGKKSVDKMVPAEDLDGLVESFADHIAIFKDCGYDMMSFNSIYYVSPVNNRRTDEYGAQNPENGSRFLKMLFSAVKRKLGKDFLIELLVFPEQENAYNFDYMLGILKNLEDVVDVVFIKETDSAANHPTGYNFTKGHHPALQFSKGIKDACVNVVTVVNGGFQDPDEMESYLADGLCDMFGLGRGLIADNDYMQKVLENRPEDIVPCLWCNKCHGLMRGPWISVCSVNPIFGDEHKLHRLVKPSTGSKKVAIIGGGPAGMRAALFASERGHDVTLFEKSGKLGGQLFHADYSPFKWPLRDYKNWLIKQLEKSRVNVVMNCAPSPDDIRKSAFEALIAATGAVPNIPGIPGLKDADDKMKPEFMTCLDVYGHEERVGQRVVIVGGSETGAETGMYLAGLGRDVTVLTRQKEIAHDAAKLHYITMAFGGFDKNGYEYFKAAWEMYDNFAGIVNVNTVAVTENAVTYIDADQSVHTIEADSVIICGGMNACRDEALQYYDCTNRFLMAGDCEKPGNLQICSRDAFARASQI